MERTIKPKPTVTHDSVIPMTEKQKDAVKAKIPDEDCFGKMWDMRARACQVCADNEVCSIMYADVVKAKVKAVEDKYPTMLDYADLSLIDEGSIMDMITKGSGKLTVQELVDELKKQSRLDDDVAMVEWVKRFREQTEKAFSIKKGIVYAES